MLLYIFGSETTSITVKSTALAMSYYPTNTFYEARAFCHGLNFCIPNTTKLYFQVKLENKENVLLVCF